MKNAESEMHLTIHGQSGERGVRVEVMYKSQEPNVVVSEEMVMSAVLISNKLYETSPHIDHIVLEIHEMWQECKVRIRTMLKNAQGGLAINSELQSAPTLREAAAKALSVVLEKIEEEGEEDHRDCGTHFGGMAVRHT